MITIGIVISDASAECSAHMIRGLCRRAKEKENVNLIFFSEVLCKNLKEAKETEDFYTESVSFVDVLLISDQKMLQMLLEQPEGTSFSNVLEHVPYMLLKDDAGQVLDQACALAEGLPDDVQEDNDEDLFEKPGQTKAQKRERFERALEFAMRAHKGQVRKGSSVPYIVHPIETALITMTLTRDQDIVIAALFHDVVEDTRYSAKDIEDAFGSRVAQRE